MSSAAFWEERYARGDGSGAGSVGALARFKADYLNNFVAENEVENVIEFGCGDGAQLELAEYPHYLGLDVSPTAIELCRQRFSKKTWAFEVIPSAGRHIGYDLALSLDVIYHLVEDEVFERHMHAVFMASKRFVILYTTSQDDERTDIHVRHRPVALYVAGTFVDWTPIDFTPNPWPPESDFFAYEKIETEDEHLV